ncbi:hypothetical protein [Nonomuraea sp. SBT364]|uniref:hypothetical protein n=1 Tax=Nonomuraea sp. SBT364 TaxID=1580530 RepID=UPI0012E25FA9|nr:hypothetical protein [Nonomuraea sp. SBT364]
MKTSEDRVMAVADTGDPAGWMVTGVEQHANEKSRLAAPETPLGVDGCSDTLDLQKRAAQRVAEAVSPVTVRS